MAVNDGSHSVYRYKILWPGFTGMSTSGFPRYASSIKLNYHNQKHLLYKLFQLNNMLKKKEFRPDLIERIDIEEIFGEMDVWKGACNVINDFKPAISFEGGDNERTEINNTESCINYLQKHKYDIFEYDFTKSKIIKFYSKRYL